MTPAKFVDIHERFNECTEDALATNLIHEGFSPEAAKNTAAVYKENSAIADLQKKEYVARAPEVPPPALEGKPKNETDRQTPKFEQPKPASEAGVLATYSIPLGSNEATLTFQGDVLTAEDFDALGEFVEFAKKQFERKSKARSEYPKAAIWKNGDSDKPVTIVGVMGTKDGQTFYQSKTEACNKLRPARWCR